MADAVCENTEANFSCAAATNGADSKLEMFWFWLIKLIAASNKRIGRQTTEQSQITWTLLQELLSCVNIQQRLITLCKLKGYREGVDKM